MLHCPNTGEYNIMKNYIGISRDHSGSMSHLTRAAAKDYNTTIEGLKQSAITENIDTIMSVVKCGYGRISGVHREITNSSIVAISPIYEYEANAPGTPLFDSVGELIEMFESTPDVNDPDVSFLVMAVTDGEENDSKKWSRIRLVNKIKELQATDRWTFVFRVPRGYKQHLVGLGFHEGNIHEWEQTERGVQQATQVTTNAFQNYYADLKKGVKSTCNFYTTNLTEVDIASVKAQLIDVSSQVSFWNVDSAHANTQIRDFCEAKSGAKMLKGAGFYQLVKPEKEVQDYKLIAIRDRSTGAVYIGPAARDLLGLPHYGMISLRPGDHAGYDVFVQSTSVNRKLPLGTTVMYWPNVGKAYQEGRSA